MGLVEVAQALGISQVYSNVINLYANRTAVVGEDGLDLTYRELGAVSNRLAAYLMQSGVMRGQRVGVLAEPCPESIVVYVACAQIGVTVVGLNTRSTTDDTAWCVNDSDVQRIFYDDASAGRFEELKSVGADRAGVRLDLRHSGTPGEPTLADVVETAGAVPEIRAGNAHDIHAIIYTSGTTGRPKGAMISQAASAIRALRIASWFGLGGDDAFLGWSPLFHTAGEETLNATLLSGGRYLTHRKALADRLVDSVETNRATWGFLLPGIFAEFLEVASTRPEAIHTFRFGGGYGNLLPTRLIDELIDLGPVFYDLLGQTEASLLIASNRISQKGETEWRKVPTPLLDVQVIDEDGQSSPPGEAGELIVRGPSVMSGYLNNPEATAEVFADGWLHTGDLVRRHEDGTLVFADRRKYLIKTGGENVYPAEVEAAVSSHPAVAEVCVVGVADDRWGETVKAFVVLREGSKVAPSELTEYCRGSLAAYKLPRVVEFLSRNEVPRGITGKIVRAELLQRPPSRGGD
jgi:fatty-acyl-CoA synthase